MTAVWQSHSCQHGEDYVGSFVIRKTLKKVVQVVAGQHKQIREWRTEDIGIVRAGIRMAFRSGQCSARVQVAESAPSSLEPSRHAGIAQRRSPRLATLATKSLLGSGAPEASASGARAMDVIHRWPCPGGMVDRLAINA